MEADRYKHLKEAAKHQAHLAFRDLIKHMLDGETFDASLSSIEHDWDLNPEQIDLVKAYYIDFHS